MLQGTNIKENLVLPPPTGELLQAIDQLRYALGDILNETKQMYGALEPVMCAAAPEANKPTSVVGYSTPLATTIKNLTEQAIETRRLLADANARLSI